MSTFSFFFIKLTLKYQFSLILVLQCTVILKNVQFLSDIPYGLTFLQNQRCLLSPLCMGSPSPWPVMFLLWITLGAVDAAYLSYDSAHAPSFSCPFAFPLSLFSKISDYVEEGHAH
ncbi:hypothetical protein XENTR_v10012128 [Xenopus tropicalis]|nr:hypothetical protein XENTR_v10012128 [Xenopus tropicalis]